MSLDGKVVNEISKCNGADVNGAIEEVDKLLSKATLIKHLLMGSRKQPRLLDRAT